MVKCKRCLGKIEGERAYWKGEFYHPKCQDIMRRNYKLQKKESWLDDLLNKRKKA